ncbi:hypothetical protein L228DRAFT_267797 [Xylona heveae TC161]|uniref:Uncharacterized protein n=1 Tax=Xylona heveae (strain CBS 132557 / TC161) TaxID=1328760 RepID=A0A165HQJ1_XYLHT|nr:hypothetical protein L228DRAFT_267797 [Xylona heveae TC161]KZF23836.1 hypothetical protein L228DRAFT_267797 [Xylona heveae TC161]
MPFTFETPAAPPGAFPADVHVEDPLTGVAYSHIEYAVMEAAPARLKELSKTEAIKDSSEPPPSHCSGGQHHQQVYPHGQVGGCAPSITVSPVDSGRAPRRPLRCAQPLLDDNLLSSPEPLPQYTPSSLSPVTSPSSSRECALAPDAPPPDYFNAKSQFQRPTRVLRTPEKSVLVNSDGAPKVAGTDDVHARKGKSRPAEPAQRIWPGVWPAPKSVNPCLHPYARTADDFAREIMTDFLARYRNWNLPKSRAALEGLYTIVREQEQRRLDYERQRHEYERTQATLQLQEEAIVAAHTTETVPKRWGPAFPYYNNISCRSPLSRVSSDSSLAYDFEERCGLMSTSRREPVAGPRAKRGLGPVSESNAESEPTAIERLSARDLDVMTSGTYFTGPRPYFSANSNNERTENSPCLSRHSSSSSRSVRSDETVRSLFGPFSGKIVSSLSKKQGENITETEEKVKGKSKADMHANTPFQIHEEELVDESCFEIIDHLSDMEEQEAEEYLKKIRSGSKHGDTLSTTLQSERRPA